MRALHNRLCLQPGDLFEELTASVEDLLALMSDSASELPEGDAIAEIEPPSERIHEWRADWEPSLLRYLDWKRESKLALPDDPVLDLHFALMRFAAVLNLLWPGFLLRCRTAQPRRAARPRLPRPRAGCRSHLPSRSHRRS